MHSIDDRLKSVKALIISLCILILALVGLLLGFRNETVILQIKDKCFEVEVARTKSARAKGLMYREYLARDSGMIFVFEKPQILRFWMKNTKIPLSIAFISANGKILDIQKMEPESIDEHISPEPAKYALEMNQGWFERNNIKVGDIIKGLEKL